MSDEDIENDPFAPYFPSGFTVRDEANALTAWALRNEPNCVGPRMIEDSHAHACRQLAELIELSLSNPEEYDHQIKSYGF